MNSSNPSIELMKPGSQSNANAHDEAVGEGTRIGNSLVNPLGNIIIAFRNLYIYTFLFKSTSKIGSIQK